MNKIYTLKRINVYISIGSFAIYFFLYCLLFNYVGSYIVILVIFPLTYVAWSYGKFLGPSMGILGVIISTSLGSYFIHKFYIFNPLTQAISIIILIYLGFVIGWLSDTKKELKNEISRQKSLYTTKNNGLESDIADYQEIKTVQNQLNLEIISELIPDGLLVLNQQGIILFANYSCKTIFESILHHDLPKFYNISNGDKNVLFNSLSDLITAPEEKEMIIEPEIGYYYKLKSFFLKSNGCVDNSVIIIEFQNITDFITAERFQKQIIRTVSHELRVPLTNLSLSVKQLRKYYLQLTTDQRNRLFDILNLNVSVLNDMVEDLLTYEKFSIKSLHYSFLHFTINESINNVIQQLEPKIQNKHLSIAKNTLAEYVLLGDQKRIEQAVRIVLDNAIKYSPENSNISILSYLRLSNLDQRKEPSLVIVIEDHGLGIPKEDLSHIFKRFFRSNNVKGHQGTGIGLSLAKEIIDYHGGTIHLNSELNQFTTVTIELPNKN